MAAMRLHLDTRGDGLPVVVLPSFSLAHSAMASAMEPAFTGRDRCRRIYVDLPGTGSSPAGVPHSDQVLDDVVDTIRQELSEESFALVGWSYGGFLAAGVTRRMGSQARGLMMVCSALRIHPEHRDLTGVLPSVPERSWLAGVPEHWHDHFTQAIGCQTAEVAHRIASVLKQNPPTDEGYLSELRTNGLVLSEEHMAAPRDIQACLVAGRRDRVAGYLGLFNALDCFDHADYVLSGEAGHYLPLEDPEFFAAALHNWLDRCGT